MNLNLENNLDFRKKLPKEISFDKSEKKIIFICESDGDVNIKVNKKVELELVFVFLPSEQSNPKKYNMVFDLEDYVKLDMKVANLTNFDTEEIYTINFNGENSGIEFYESTIINKSFNKKSVINPIHLSRATYSNIRAFEVLKDQSRGFIRCISDIRKGSSQSEAHQELRLLVLDESARADSDPVLLIDENDIVASHANAIGMLDEDQIFYLLARGLTLPVAQEVIVNGYFEPVFIAIDDEKNIELFKSILKEMI